MLVMVGATNVGKISMSFDPEIVTNRSHFRQLIHKVYEPKISVEKGQELGVFNMGSTVIVLATPGVFEKLPGGLGQKVKMGESINFRED